MKADDGITDLYGVMYKPFDFDPAKQVPDHRLRLSRAADGERDQDVHRRAATRCSRTIGFIVIEVGNRGGNPQRSKWYHNFGYGNLRDYGLADKKAAIEQLAPQVSVDRYRPRRIWGHSGGGFMTAAAMLVYPDFFKVGWSESGNHENNIYNNTWSEKHHGVKEVDDKDGKVTFEYTIDKNSRAREESEGPPDAGHRRHRQQRAPGQYATGWPTR